MSSGNLPDIQNRRLERWEGRGSFFFHRECRTTSQALYLLSYRVRVLVGQIDGLYRGIEMGKKAFVGANTNLLLRDKLYLEKI